jgi:hypothetical protein
MILVRLLLDFWGIMVLAAWAYVVLTQKHDPPKGRPPRAISGVRAGAYLEDWRRVLRQIPTPKDLWELNQQLGRTYERANLFFPSNDTRLQDHR